MKPRHEIREHPCSSVTRLSIGVGPFAVLVAICEGRALEVLRLLAPGANSKASALRHNTMRQAHVLQRGRVDEVWYLSGETITTAKRFWRELPACLRLQAGNLRYDMSKAIICCHAIRLTMLSAQFD